MTYPDDCGRKRVTIVSTRDRGRGIRRGNLSVVDWLLASIVVSVVLTVLLNVGLRAFPGAGDRAARRLEDLATRPRQGGRRVQVWFMWKAMLAVSVGVTVLLNLVAWLR